MIQANELRIGINIYYNDVFEIGDIDGTNLKVIKVDAATINWASNNIEQFNRAHKPIPLTEEWLVKFGFEKTEPRFAEYLIGNFRVCLTDEDRYVFTGWNDIWVYLDNIHSLQNLYAALTGEELQLQTPVL